MAGLVQILLVLGLGLFWATGPALGKLLGMEGVPVPQVVMTSGFSVGLALVALQRLGGTRVQIGWREMRFGFGCSILTTIPFALGLVTIRHVPVTLMALVTSTSPMWTYAIALVLRREVFSPLRVAALGLGLASSLCVILTRSGANLGGADLWVALTLTLPVFWAIYNNFASLAWPAGMPPMTAGTVESFASGLLGTAMLVLPAGSDRAASAWSGSGYLLLLAVIVMWVLERLCFFNLIQKFGPVTAVQATYVATPGSVLLGVLFFAEPPDAWLWISLALLMAALWLNQRATARQTSPAPAPEAAERPANGPRR